MTITLAIPNYNGAKNLESLLRRCFEEDFKSIYVLDDASTDNSLEILRRLQTMDSRLKIVQGKKNVGAGANRNRILPYINKGLVYFLDVDMSLMTKGVCNVIEQAFEDQSTGMVGGLIFAKNGSKMKWNFGQEMSRRNELINFTGQTLCNVFGWIPGMGNILFKRFSPHSLSWMTEYRKDQIYDTDWVAEGSFAVRTDLFAQMGGFDKSMRYHEAQDLGRRVREAGFKIIHNSKLKARHLKINVRGFRRYLEMFAARSYFYKKYSK